jgi:hypothetical protein
MVDIDTVYGGNHVLRTTGFHLTIAPSTCSDPIKGIDAGHGVFLNRKGPAIDTGDIVVQYQGFFKTKKQHQALQKKGQFDWVRCEHRNPHDIVTCSSVVPSSDCPTGRHTHCVEVLRGLYLDGRPDPVFPAVSLDHIVLTRGRCSLFFEIQQGEIRVIMCGSPRICFSGYPNNLWYIISLDEPRVSLHRSSNGDPAVGAPTLLPWSTTALPVAVVTTWR